MSEYDRPREKALAYGIHVLTNKELLAVLLRSGIPGKSVLELAEEILSLRNHLGELSQIQIHELMQIKGIKEAKALELLACFELSRRISYQQIEDKDVMNSPKALVRWLNKQIGYFDQEHFFVLFLNTKNHIISYKSMFVGSGSSCQVSAKEVFTEAMRLSAQKIIIAHNHPSGNIEPSISDMTLTKAILEVGNLCGIPLLDHIIVGKNNYYSFKENQRID